MARCLNIGQESHTGQESCSWLSRLAARTFLMLLTAATASAQFTPVYSASSVPVASVSMATLNLNCSPPGIPQCPYVVTAVRNGSGNLEVMVWHDTGKAIEQTGSDTAGPIVFNLGVAVMKSNMVVTAVFDSTVNLELISWQVGSDGSIKRLQTLNTKQSGINVAVTSGPLDSSCNCFATAADTGANATLNVSVWKVDSSTGAITAGDTIAGGKFGQIAIATSGAGMFWTMLSNSDGNLEVTAWNYSDGKLHRNGTSTGGHFNGVAATYTGNPEGFWDLTMAWINSSGNLEVTLWQTPTTPNARPKQVASGTAGPASALSGRAVTLEDGIYPVTAVRDKNGNLSVQAWPFMNTWPNSTPNPNGYANAYSYNTASAITNVTVASENLTGTSPPGVHIVTASVDNAGKLEMTVFQLHQPAWTYNVKPFDLVWDGDNPDYNGLPLNPLWAYQLNNQAETPNFMGICGPAFSGYSTIDIAKFEQDCTSQGPATDPDTSDLVGVGGYCFSPGPYSGHLNWTIATYTGNVVWENWSGDAELFENFDLSDGDYNLFMRPDEYAPYNNAGYTTLNWSPSADLGIGLEFNDSETVDNFGDPWWQQLVNGAENGGQPSPAQLFNGNDGLKGVVTGLIGIDGVHGGYTESHPVFAIALRTGVTSIDDGVQENWVLFLRNWGTEGACSELTHYWPAANNTFYIQLPWPQDATALKRAHSGQHFGAYGADVTHLTIGFQVSDPGWTVFKLQNPPGGPFYADGDFVLEYSLPAGHKAERHKHEATATPSETEKKDRDVTLLDIAARIADPAVRAKFTADAREALKPLSSRPRLKEAPINLDTTIKVEPRAPRVAGQGKLTPGQASPDPAKKQVDEALKRLVDTYRSQLPAVPAVKK